MSPQQPQNSTTNSNGNDNKLERVAELVGIIPGITSYNADWRNIMLETFDVLPGETPECSTENYTIGIYLGQEKDIRVRQITDNKCQESTFFPGSAVIFPFNCSHFFEWDRKARALCLTIKPHFLHSNATELLGRDRIELLPKLGFQDGLIHQIGLALQLELKTSAVPDRLYAETLANTLAVHLLKHYSAYDNPNVNIKGGLSQQKLKLVTDYINDSLSKELSLQELASIAQLSQYHFCRTFKRSTGQTPHQYLIQQRIERAKQLLKQSSMTLAEIAIHCGFTHQSHLHRYFKRLTGVTPKAWTKL